MTFFFLLSLAVILYTYAGYPLAIALLARLRPRAWHRAPWPAGPAPISVVMAVHNGAAMLTAQLNHLLTLDAHLIHEVIVVCDGSTDATPSILTQTVHPRLKSILLPQQAGKSAALNHGIAAATAEILLFVDIRPHVEPGALAALLTNFADPTIGCVAGELLLQSDGQDATTSAVSAASTGATSSGSATAKPPVDSPVGVYGGFYAIRRALATRRARPASSSTTCSSPSPSSARAIAASSTAPRSSPTVGPPHAAGEFSAQGPHPRR